MNRAVLWRPVAGYEDLYEVSSYGVVRRIGKPQGLRWHPGRGNYPRVTLSKVGRGRHFYVHKLVALAFLGPRPVGKEINHKDRNRWNPRADNLEFLTRAENIRHSAVSYRAAIARGEARPGAKLNEEEVRQIKRSSDPYRTLAARFGVSHCVVGAIKRGRKWTHVAA